MEEETSLVSDSHIHTLEFPFAAPQTRSLGSARQGQPRTGFALSAEREKHMHGATYTCPTV